MDTVTSSKHHPDHDLGPDDFRDVEWSGAERVPPNPDVRVVYEVPVTDAQLKQLEDVASARGVSTVGAIQALVQEGLEAWAESAGRGGDLALPRD